jgi:HEAT repeat protein
MRMRIFLVTVIFAGNALAQQVDSDQALARMLSKDDTRDDAVARVAGVGPVKVPLLLSWTRTAPEGVEQTGLYLGMAEVFGLLRVKEAIPFLIGHISLQAGFAAPNLWMKTPAAIESRLPAVKALIQIGPESSKVLMGAAWDRMSPEDRLAALFVVSRVGGGPEARAFVVRALGEANLQRYWAEEGLKLLDSRTQP